MGYRKPFDMIAEINKAGKAKLPILVRERAVFSSLALN